MTTSSYLKYQSTPKNDWFLRWKQLIKHDRLALGLTIVRKPLMLAPQSNHCTPKTCNISRSAEGASRVTNVLFFSRIDILGIQT